LEFISSKGLKLIQLDIAGGKILGEILEQSTDLLIRIVTFSLEGVCARKLIRERRTCLLGDDDVINLKGIIFKIYMQTLESQDIIFILTCHQNLPPGWHILRKLEVYRSRNLLLQFSTSKSDLFCGCCHGS